MDFKAGEVVKGRVTGIKPYGAFISLEGGYTGLLHISEISDDFVSHIEDFVKYGDEIELYILEVETFTKHLKLSLKHLNKSPKKKRVVFSRQRKKQLDQKEDIIQNLD